MTAKMKIILCLISIMFGLSSFAQHETEYHNYHRITGLLGYSLVDNSFTASTNDLLIVPTFGINYDYFFHKSWGVGLHSDIVLQQFTIERHHDKEEIVRDNPIAVCGIIIFKLTHHWSLLGGYGVEYEKHESLDLIRFGVEYEIPIQNNWEISFTTEYDYKFEA